MVAKQIGSTDGFSLNYTPTLAMDSLPDLNHPAQAWGGGALQRKTGSCYKMGVLSPGSYLPIYFLSKLDEDYLYMAYADIMAKVRPCLHPGQVPVSPAAMPVDCKGWGGLGVSSVHLMDFPSPELPLGGRRGGWRS